MHAFTRRCACTQTYSDRNRLTRHVSRLATRSRMCPLCRLVDIYEYIQRYNVSIEYFRALPCTKIYRVRVFRLNCALHGMGMVNMGMIELDFSLYFFGRDEQMRWNINNTSSTSMSSPLLGSHRERARRTRPV